MREERLDRLSRKDASRSVTSTVPAAVTTIAVRRIILHWHLHASLLGMDPEGINTSDEGSCKR